MAVPKKKPSRHRTRTNKTAWLNKPKRIVYQDCPHCGKPSLTHRVCSNCGFYKGKQIIKVKKEEKAP